MKKWMLAGLALLINGCALAEDYGSYYVEESSPSGTAVVVVLVIALIAAIVVVSVMKSKLKIAKRQHGADNYIREGSFKLTARHDHFLYETVSRRKIEKKEN